MRRKSAYTCTKRNWARCNDDEAAKRLEEEYKQYPEHFTDAPLIACDYEAPYVLANTSAKAIDPMKKWL